MGSLFMSVCMFMFVIGYMLCICDIFLPLEGIAEIILQTALFKQPKQINFHIKLCLYKLKLIFLSSAERTNFSLLLVCS